MEVTSSLDRVVCNPDSSRRQWKSPDSSVISSLQDRPVVEGTVTIASDKSGKNASSESSLSSSNASQDAESSANREADSTPTCSSPSEKTSDQTFPAKDQIEFHVKIEQKLKANIEKKDEESKPSIPPKPPLPARPKDKPLNLPTPKLLPKPDKPMEFGKASVPSASHSQGEGSLFEKVQLEDEEEDQEEKEEREKNKIAIEDVEEEETNKDEKTKDKQRNGVALGLTSGSFDINNTQMLRTCSEPDLSSLFRTIAKESPQVKRKSLDMSSVQEEDEKYFEELLSSFENALKVDNPEEGADNPKEDKEVEEEVEEEQEEDEDYEDLLSVRETMKSLLLQDDDDDGNSVKFSLSSSHEDTPDGSVGVDKKKSTDEGKSKTDRKDRSDGEGNTEDGDDEEEVEEDGEEEEHEDSVENEEEIDSSHPHRSVSVDNDNPQSPDERAEMMAELFQSDEESDSEFQDEGGENGEDYDLFSRLEESRAFLEKELGCQKFLKVYKTVQALQEDEDENMEDGARIAIEMLGKDKEHLYPKIFQLVMADTAFTEENLQ
ncbi:hypothetical protein CHS0354_012566 [Potamilus streckersoni]|uniref:non-specific serine/threonine protein kinase n=1 Tax=Potamilus streckersoni TaxID=2493646 RepID=A0AAE0W3P3_9BIVA|nr:hypothetical protein CHS0354_012566 [Potamilus streckersoni]